MTNNWRNKLIQEAEDDTIAEMLDWSVLTPLGRIHGSDIVEMVETQFEGDLMRAALLRRVATLEAEAQHRAPAESLLLSQIETLKAEVAELRDIQRRWDIGVDSVSPRALTRWAGAYLEREE